MTSIEITPTLTFKYNEPNLFYDSGGFETVPPSRVWGNRPQFWEEHGFTGDNDPRFREICQRYPDDVLLQRPHEIFQPPPPATVEPITFVPHTTPSEQVPIGSYTSPIEVIITRTTNTTASLFDVAPPDREEVKPEAKDEPKPPAHCEKCGSSVEDLGDIVQLEAPPAYLEKHIEDNAPCLKFWHRKCFEAQYKIKLPEFPMGDLPPEPRPVSRRILIKDSPQGAQNAVR